jgi:hypothetical protein
MKVRPVLLGINSKIGLYVLIPVFKGINMAAFQILWLENMSFMNCHAFILFAIDLQMLGNLS